VTVENSWSNVCNRITISYTLTEKSLFRFLLCVLLLVSLVIEHVNVHVQDLFVIFIANY